MAALLATGLILAISLSYDPTPTGPSGGETSGGPNNRNVARLIVVYTALALPTLASIAAVVVDRMRRARFARFTSAGVALLGALAFALTGTVLFLPCVVLLLVSGAATMPDQ